MLQKNKMVTRAKQAIESLYNGNCSIIERQKIKNTNKSIGFTEVVVLENIPCRLSYKNITDNNQMGNLASEKKQLVTLFLNPDINIKPGSKIIITQNNRTVEYSQSGEPAIYLTHQEVILEVFKGWS